MFFVYLNEDKPKKKVENGKKNEVELSCQRRPISVLVIKLKIINLKKNERHFMHRRRGRNV